jgi:hypothetical protein
VRRGWSVLVWIRRPHRHTLGLMIRAIARWGGDGSGPWASNVGASMEEDQHAEICIGSGRFAFIGRYCRMGQGKWARDAEPDWAEFSDCDVDRWPRVGLADRQGSSKPRVDRSSKPRTDQGSSCSRWGGAEKCYVGEKRRARWSLKVIGRTRSGLTEGCEAPAERIASLEKTGALAPSATRHCRQPGWWSAAPELN